MRLCLLIYLIFTAIASAQVEIKLIPFPVKIKASPGNFVLNKGEQETARFKIVTDKTQACYHLSVKPDHIIIRAKDDKAAFYGEQTLKQLIQADGVTIPCVEITDFPRFEWRGLMLDCSRTFQSIEYIKKIIDCISYYKMNVLHLHLTDDQGWRLEMQKYPELTGKGARFPEKYNEPDSHHGFYTQEEIKELVQYAGKRFVTLVPEIEMPGHSLAALSCYPDLSCTGGPFEIYPFFKGPGITQDIFCAGNDKTFEFFENVLKETASLFPSKYIHVGGDEAPKTRWKSCKRCQKRIQEEKLEDEHELQSYFIKRAEKILKKYKKQLIGWDEILEGGLAPDAAVMSWRGTKGGIEAAKTGHDVVMSPTSHCYFDYSYGRINTKRAYLFEPIPEELEQDKQKHILGLQANFWSHIDRSEAKTDRMLFPRLLSIAERGWSKKSMRNWEDFKKRVRANLEDLKGLGIQYYPLDLGVVVGGWTPETVSESYKEITWDITDHVIGKKDINILFQYVKGAHRLGIQWVSLMEDQKEIYRDVHRGVTGARDEGNVYIIKLKHIRNTARYSIRASVRSEGGVDSHGEVKLLY